MKKIYISGQISGLPYLEAYNNFSKACLVIASQLDFPVNPMYFDSLARFEHKTIIPTWQQFMRTDIKLLCDCDAIYMLNNYQNSKGALTEREIAIRLGLEVIYEL